MSNPIDAALNRELNLSLWERIKVWYKNTDVDWGPETDSFDDYEPI